MAHRFTLGVEEEFQMVDKHTGQLASHIHALMDKSAPLFGEHIKAEMLQSAVELITNVCPDITTLRLDLQNLRSQLINLVEAEGLALISSGTHPTAHWKDQERTHNPRYEELEEEYQDVGRSILIFGLHAHVGVENQEIAISLLNQLRTWIPHLLAISSNSPFWAGRHTGLKSYRSIVWKRFPRSGVPMIFSSYRDFDGYVQGLINTGCIDNGKRIWWDVRPHPFFNTVEFRIADMPATLEDTLAMTAFVQALVAKLSWMHKRNLTTHALPAHFIEENKWKASRYGLDAEYVDFVQQRRMTMRESIGETLDFVDDVLDDLGSRREINYLRTLLEDPRGTGADRQLAVYKETGSLYAVTHYLMRQVHESSSINNHRSW